MFGGYAIMVKWRGKGPWRRVMEKKRGYHKLRPLELPEWYKADCMAIARQIVRESYRVENSLRLPLHVFI